MERELILLSPVQREVFRRLEKEQRQTGDNSSGQVRNYGDQGQ